MNTDGVGDRLQAPSTSSRRSAKNALHRPVFGFPESEVIGVCPRPVKRLPDLPLAHAIDTAPDPGAAERVT